MNLIVCLLFEGERNGRQFVHYSGHNTVPDGAIQSFGDARIDVVGYWECTECSENGAGSIHSGGSNTGETIGRNEVIVGNVTNASVN